VPTLWFPLKEPDGRRKPVEIWEMIRMVATPELSCLKLKFVYPQDEMSREGQAMCFCWCKFYFCRRQIIDYPNPDVNEDMKMFEMLGLNPQNHLLKFLNQQQLKLQILNLLP
jgi:biotin synthase